MMSNINPSLNTGYVILIVIAIFMTVSLAFLVNPPKNSDFSLVQETEIVQLAKNP